MNAAITKARAMYIEGAHLHSCFADAAVRQRGWQLMQRAKRILRRLNVNLHLS